MDCELCFDKYDHSLHRPFSLQCLHTFCFNCMKQLTSCPVCKGPIGSRTPNWALLRLVPESAYDNSKTEFLRVLSEINELKSRIDKNKEVKLKDNELKIKDIRKEIHYETDKLIQNLLSNRDILKSQLDSIETEMKNSLTNQGLTNSINTLNNAKKEVEENNLNEQQLANLNKEATIAKLIASKLIESIDKMNNSSIYLEKRFDLNIGEIKNSQDMYSSYIKQGIKARDNDAKFNDALNLFEKAINLFPHLLDAYNEKGFTYYKLNAFDKAIECYDKCLLSNSEKFLYERNALFLFNKSLALIEMKSYNDAMEHLNKSIELNPDYAPAYFFKGKIKVKLKELDEAIPRFNKAIELDPNYHEAYQTKGDAFYEKENFAEAEKCYEKAIQIQPLNFAYHARKGNCLVHFKKYDEAIKCFNASVKLNPNYGNGFELTALCLLELKEFRAAVDALDRAIELEPANKSYRKTRELAIKEIPADNCKIN